MLHEQTILHDRYRLQTKLGQTTGRQTWLAEDLGTTPTQTVIVKLLAFADQMNWETLKLFEREASILRQLDHPKIPKYQNYFSIDDRVLWFGLVQDYIPGNSLKDLLVQGQRFSQTEVRKIASEILAILIYLHELSPPVLHRDLKPSNLILGEDQQIYMIDFGAVQDRAAVEGATFTVVGTYGYAPIEQFGGRTVPASDLYSLGATLIHLLTGTAPADLPQDKFRIQFNHVVSVSPSLVAWIEKLTDPDVKQRFSTARQALTALKTPQTQPDRNPRQSYPLSQSPGSARTLRYENSRVTMRTSPTQLLVQIPGERQLTIAGGMLGGIGLMALGIVLTVPHPPSFFFCVIGVVLFLAKVHTSATTVAVLNHQDFTLSRETALPFYTASRRLITCDINAIQNIIHHKDPRHAGRVITIQTNADDISFAQKLSRNECAWIVQEMNCWLNAQRS